MKRLLAVLSVLMVAACGTSDSEGKQPPSPPATTSEATASPTQPAKEPTGAAAAVKKLMQALDDGDCKTVKKLVLTPSQITCEDVQAAAGSFAEEGNDLAAATYTARTPHGSTVKVIINWGSENPNEYYNVEKVNGTWKVDFDSAA